ncbi:hypothetical protein EXIGUO9Y_90008 [Exiguobacterium oxidotolerans]|uniref:Uncharacterized protein n=1 Tax=Exiguobacterium oxidotolerans TaxID=223958 RepID=A0A653II15_9BACL|nr:hypothetical protein EXIGUO9Y_90008 [Exiguobacterium oxidotolerans]
MIRYSSNNIRKTVETGIIKASSPVLFLHVKNRTYVLKKKELGAITIANIKKNTKTGLWWVRLSLGTDECGKRIQAYYSNKRKQEVEFWISEQVSARRTVPSGRSSRHARWMSSSSSGWRTMSG